MRTKAFVVLSALLVVAAAPLAFAQQNPEDPGSVYNYAINWAVQTGPTEITVEAQARYCSACNPNWGGASGCTAFGPCFTGYGHRYCSQSYPNGTYITVRIKDSGGTVLGMQKLVLQSGVNLTLNVICKWQFTFGGLSLTAGDTVTVEADTYCSWCGHWYPTPLSLTVQAADATVAYTGDTSGVVGTSAAVSVVLADADTGDPLPGREITFTLEDSGVAAVSATTDDDGIAQATMPIPDGTAAGTYTMDARFAGDAEYWPSSDQVDFEVIVQIDVDIDIKPGSDPNAINLGSNGVIPVAILGSADFDVSWVDPSTVSLGSSEVAVRGKGNLMAKTEDVNGDGFLDLVCHVETENLVLGDIQDGMMVLTGNLYPEYDAIPIVGADYVFIVPPE